MKLIYILPKEQFKYDRQNLGFLIHIYMLLDLGLRITPDLTYELAVRLTVSVGLSVFFPLSSKNKQIIQPYCV